MVNAVTFLTQRRRDTELSLRSQRLCVKKSSARLHFGSAQCSVMLFELFKISWEFYKSEQLSANSNNVIVQRATVKDCPYEGSLYQIMRVNDFEAIDVVEI